MKKEQKKIKLPKENGEDINKFFKRKAGPMRHKNDKRKSSKKHNIDEGLENG